MLLGKFDSTSSRCTHVKWNILIWRNLKSKSLFWFICYYPYWIHASLHMQGVLRVRKRVTLMGETVTAMFGICWAPDVIVHNVSSYSAISIREDAYAVIRTLILFSAAVNPFVNALVNKNVREKLKEMLSCSSTSSTVSTRGPHELCRQNLTSTAGSSSL